MRTVIFHLCICILVQSVSVFSLAVFLWALLPEIKWIIVKKLNSLKDLVRTTVAELNN